MNVGLSTRLASLMIVSLLLVQVFSPVLMASVAASPDGGGSSEEVSSPIVPSLYVYNRFGAGHPWYPETLNRTRFNDSFLEETNLTILYYPLVFSPSLGRVTTLEMPLGEAAILVLTPRLLMEKVLGNLSHVTPDVVEYECCIPKLVPSRGGSEINYTFEARSYPLEALAGIYSLYRWRDFALSDVEAALWGLALLQHYNTTTFEVTIEVVEGDGRLVESELTSSLPASFFAEIRGVGVPFSEAEFSVPVVAPKYTFAPWRKLSWIVDLSNPEDASKPWVLQIIPSANGEVAVNVTVKPVALSAHIGQSRVFYYTIKFTPGKPLWKFLENERCYQKSVSVPVKAMQTSEGWMGEPGFFPVYLGKYISLWFTPDSTSAAESMVSNFKITGYTELGSAILEGSMVIDEYCSASYYESRGSAYPEGDFTYPGYNYELVSCEYSYSGYGDAYYVKHIEVHVGALLGGALPIPAPVGVSLVSASGCILGEIHDTSWNPLSVNEVWLYAHEEQKASKRSLLDASWIHVNQTSTLCEHRSMSESLQDEVDATPRSIEPRFGLFDLCNGWLSWTVSFNLSTSHHMEQFEDGFQAWSFPSERSTVPMSWSYTEDWGYTEDEYEEVSPFSIPSYIYEEEEPTPPRKAVSLDAYLLVNDSFLNPGEGVNVTIAVVNSGSEDVSALLSFSVTPDEGFLTPVGNASCNLLKRVAVPAGKTRLITMFFKAADAVPEPGVRLSLRLGVDAEGVSIYRSGELVIGKGLLLEVSWPSKDSPYTLLPVMVKLTSLREILENASITVNVTYESKQLYTQLKSLHSALGITRSPAIPDVSQNSTVLTVNSSQIVDVDEGIGYVIFEFKIPVKGEQTTILVSAKSTYDEHCYKSEANFTYSSKFFYWMRQSLSRLHGLATPPGKQEADPLLKNLVVAMEYAMAFFHRNPQEAANNLTCAAYALFASTSLTKALLRYTSDYSREAVEELGALLNVLFCTFVTEVLDKNWHNIAKLLDRKLHLSQLPAHVRKNLLSKAGFAAFISKLCQLKAKVLQALSKAKILEKVNRLWGSAKGFASSLGSWLTKPELLYTSAALYGAYQYSFKGKKLSELSQLGYDEKAEMAGRAVALLFPVKLAAAGAVLHEGLPSSEQMRTQAVGFYKGQAYKWIFGLINKKAKTLGDALTIFLDNQCRHVMLSHLAIPLQKFVYKQYYAMPSSEESVKMASRKTYELIIKYLDLLDHVARSLLYGKAFANSLAEASGITALLLGWTGIGGTAATAEKWTSIVAGAAANSLRASVRLAQLDILLYSHGGGVYKMTRGSEPTSIADLLREGFAVMFMGRDPTDARLELYELAKSNASAILQACESNNTDLMISNLVNFIVLSENLTSYERELLEKLQLAASSGYEQFMDLQLNFTGLMLNASHARRFLIMATIGHFLDNTTSTRELLRDAVEMVNATSNRMVEFLSSQLLPALSSLSLPADPVVIHVTAPSTVSTGEEFWVNVTVKNVGGAAAANSSLLILVQYPAAVNLTFSSLPASLMDVNASILGGAKLMEVHLGDLAVNQEVLVALRFHAFKEGFYPSAIALSTSYQAGNITVTSDFMPLTLTVLGNAFYQGVSSWQPVTSSDGVVTVIPIGDYTNLTVFIAEEPGYITQILSPSEKAVWEPLSKFYRIAVLYYNSSSHSYESVPFTANFSLCLNSTALRSYLAMGLLENASIHYYNVSEGSWVKMPSKVKAGFEVLSASFNGSGNGVYALLSKRKIALPSILSFTRLDEVPSNMTVNVSLIVTPGTKGEAALIVMPTNSSDVYTFILTPVNSSSSYLSTLNSERSSLTLMHDNRFKELLSALASANDSCTSLLSNISTLEFPENALSFINEVNTSVRSIQSYLNWLEGVLAEKASNNTFLEEVHQALLGNRSSAVLLANECSSFLAEYQNSSYNQSFKVICSGLRALRSNLALAANTTYSLVVLNNVSVAIPSKALYTASIKLPFKPGQNFTYFYHFSLADGGGAVTDSFNGTTIRPIIVEAPEDGSSIPYGEEVSFTIRAAVKPVGIEVAVDGVVKSLEAMLQDGWYLVNTSLADLAPGLHHYTVRVLFRDGSTYVKSGCFEVKLLEPFNISIAPLSRVVDYWRGSTIDLALKTYSSPAQLQVLVNGSAIHDFAVVSYLNASYSLVIPAAGSPGIYSVEIRASDEMHSWNASWLMAAVNITSEQTKMAEPSQWLNFTFEDYNISHIAVKPLEGESFNLTVGIVDPATVKGISFTATAAFKLSSTDIEARTLTLAIQLASPVSDTVKVAWLNTSSWAALNQSQFIYDEEKGLIVFNLTWPRGVKDTLVIVGITPIIRATLTLYEGWNLISLPLNLILSVKDLGEGLRAYHWNPYNKSYEEVSALKPVEGYWIYSPCEVQISLESSKAMRCYTTTLHEGWNLIGGVSKEASVNCLNGSVSKVIYWWDPLSRRYVAASIDLLPPEHGYWIYAFQKTVIEVEAKPT